jgi:endogenous inhibitor of DNA gyrase (YacG/DUF329 family)
MPQMHYILGLGIPREKLVICLAGYGRSMTLSDPTCLTDGCPVKGKPIVGNDLSSFSVSFCNNRCNSQALDLVDATEKEGTCRTLR